MILAIVGSVRLEGSLEAYRIIAEEITQFSLGRNALHSAPHIVSGGARGIDSMAIEVTLAIESVLAIGLDYTEFLPAGNSWPYYKVRNLRIAEACDELVRIVSPKSKTYGSGWTRDRAREMGKICREFVVQ